MDMCALEWATCMVLNFCLTEWTRKETKLRGKSSTVRKEHSGTCTDQWWVKLPMLLSLSHLLTDIIADIIVILIIPTEVNYTHTHTLIHPVHIQSKEYLYRQGNSFTLWVILFYSTHFTGSRDDASNSAKKQLKFKVLRRNKHFIYHVNYIGAIHDLCDIWMMKRSEHTLNPPLCISLPQTWNATSITVTTHQLRCCFVPVHTHLFSISI